MNYQIAVIPGDGIGPDVVEQTLKVMDKVGEKFGHTFNYTKVLAGGCAIDATGACLPQETIDICKASDAVLLGAVGGWKWDNLPGDQRPERALLGLRKALGLFANLRPALLFEQLADASPLKPEILAGGLDIVVVRELTGGIYFGEKGHRDTDLGPAAYDIEQYAEGEVRRIAKVAFDMAMKRSKHVTSVDKANVLESSRLWRRVVAEVAQDYPEVALDNLYVDNAAMQLVRNPRQFDVIVTSNIFGDILSDEASQITGSIGMLPSASLAEGNFGMYEPVHGSAPDIAGQDKANPMATILSAAMMLRYTFGLGAEADAIENGQHDYDGTLSDDALEFMAQRAGASIRTIKSFCQLCLLEATSKQARGEEFGREDISQIAVKKWGADTRTFTIEQIQKFIEQRYSISHADLISNKRNKGLMEPRHVAVWLARELTDSTLAQIGERFGGRTHATVKHSIKWVEDRRSEDRVVHDKIARMKEDLMAGA